MTEAAALLRNAASTLSVKSGVGLGHSFAERHAVDGNRLGSDAVVLAVGGSMTEGIHRE